MGNLHIRNVPEEVHAKLRIRAAKWGRQGTKAVIALDASALLAFLLRERGRQRGRELIRGWYQGCARGWSTHLIVVMLGALVLGAWPDRAHTAPSRATALPTTGPSDWITFFGVGNTRLHVERAGDLMFTWNFEHSALNGSEGAYRYYVQRDGQPRHFLFASVRGAMFKVGHRDRLLLIDDSCATKCERVLVGDADTGKTWRVDEPAMETYKRNFSPAPNLIITAYPIDFSPDDRQVLLSVRLVYVSVGSAGEAGSVAMTFVKVWYAVNSESGLVSGEYRSDPSHENWWVH